MIPCEIKISNGNRIARKKSTSFLKKLPKATFQELDFSFELEHNLVKKKLLLPPNIVLENSYIALHELHFVHFSHLLFIVCILHTFRRTSNFF